jgi:hypothetical protein
VRVDYPYDTPFGRSIDFPILHSRSPGLRPGSHRRSSGRQERRTGQAALALMGVPSDSHGSTCCLPPEYRNDFSTRPSDGGTTMNRLGMESFDSRRRGISPSLVTPVERLSRRVKTPGGQGIQEDVSNYLSSRSDFNDKRASTARRTPHRQPHVRELRVRAYSPCPAYARPRRFGNAAFPHPPSRWESRLPVKAENYGCKTANPRLAREPAEATSTRSVILTPSQIIGLEYRLKRPRSPLNPREQASVLWAASAWHLRRGPSPGWKWGRPFPSPPGSWT